MKKSRWTVLALQGAFFAGLIVLWQLASALKLFPEMFFPSPLQVAQVIKRGFMDQTLILASASSLRRFLIGYGISLLLGIPLGLLLGRIPWLNHTLGAAALGLQSMPSICWLPLAVLWFGLSEAAMQFVIIMGSLLAVTLATRDTVKAIPKLILRAGRILGARGWAAYLHIVLPASIPGIVSGARLGWSFAWRSLMAAEMLYVTTGLGSMLTMGRELHDMAMVVASMAMILGIGLLFNHWVFGAMERFIQVRWGVSE